MFASHPTTALRAVSLTVISMATVSSSVLAQARAPMADSSHKHPSSMSHMAAKSGMPAMSGMPMGGQQQLAMAFRDNLVNFAGILARDLDRNKQINLDLARPALEEMQRSFEHLQAYHEANTASMNASSNPSMKGMMQDMNAQLRAIGEHLIGLDGELKSATPDAGKALAHVNEILKRGGAMMPMSGGSTPHD